jgi:hypothetical protein
MTVTVTIPAGLLLVPRRINGVTKPVWDIVHKGSKRPVIKDCGTRDGALATSVSLGGIDWERDTDVILSDATARAVALAVQSEVWGESTASRRAR